MHLYRFHIILAAAAGLLSLGFGARQLLRHGTDGWRVAALVLGCAAAAALYLTRFVKKLRHSALAAPPPLEATSGGPKRAPQNPT